MDPTKNFVLKECSVILEPITPQKQLALSAELRNVINERNVLTTRTKNKVLKALDEISSPVREPNPLKEQAVEELLTSEMSYLKQLEVLMKFFIKPIRTRRLLSKEDFETLFANIETIYNVNGELLNELKKDGINVGLAFKNMAPCFKLYSMYAYGYKNAMDLLQQVRFSVNVLLCTDIDDTTQDVIVRVFIYFVHFVEPLYCVEMILWYIMCVVFVLSLFLKFLIQYLFW